MEWPLILVLGLLSACVFCFVRGYPRSDVVALAAVLVLPLSGILTVPQALAGFSDPNIVLIALLFVVGEGLTRTGVAQQASLWLVKKSRRSELKLMVLLMLAVALLGSVMSSTGTVAIFVPVVLRICQSMKIPPGRLMMPLGFAGLISGMMTLVATSPNMVLNGALQSAGFEGLAFFSFTPVGLIILALAMVYMAFVSRKLGCDESGKEQLCTRRTFTDLAAIYGLDERPVLLRITRNSRLIGKTLEEIDSRRNFQANVMAIRRENMRSGDSVRIHPGTRVQGGDLVLLDRMVRRDDGPEVRRELGLELVPTRGPALQSSAPHTGLAEIMLPPESSLIGHTIVDLRFRQIHGLNVLGLRRGCSAVGPAYLQERLRAGDTLLVSGPWETIRGLQSTQQDYVLLGLPAESDLVAPAARRMPHALASLAVMVLLMATGIVPNVLAGLIACLLMGATGCVTLQGAYQSIRLPILILIVGMMPFAAALEVTGGITLAVEGLLAVLGGAGSTGILAGMFLVTALTALFISNTATAVLMAPVALGVAGALDISPLPLVMTVAIACSAVFSSPLSAPLNALILQPGGYRFSDFVKVGAPFTLLVLIVTVLVVPLLLPLR
jgi:di/tricarboxylate transporter